MKPLVTSIVGDLGPVLLIALGATGLLLVLACVNVTNLLLARGVGRTREMALRSALGAGQRRIIRQLLTESMVLAAGGALLGFALAALARAAAADARRIDVASARIRADRHHRAAVRVGGAHGERPAHGVHAGLAARARRRAHACSTKARAAPSSGVATSRVMSGLIVAEIALAITLVAGAGWLVQSFSRLRAVDPGFVADGRLVVDVRPTRSFADPKAAFAYSDDLLGRVRAAARDAKVGAGGTVPLRGDPVGALNVELQGEPVDPNQIRGAQVRFVTPGYFEALGDQARRRPHVHR